MAYEKAFWQALRRLINECPPIIDRPKGSHHPHYPEMIYPLDYGYLPGTESMDGGGIDVWIGSDKSQTIAGICCTIDLLKKDAEIKILLGCDEKDILAITDFHNDQSMRAVFVRCPEEFR